MPRPHAEMAINQGTGISPAIFGHMAGGQNSPRYAVLHEDFLRGAALASSGHIPGSGCYGFLDAGNTIAGLATETGGVAQIATDNTDNDGPIITTGDNVYGIGKFTTAKAFAVECRVRVSSIATVSHFFGLMEPGLAVDDGIFSDAHAIVDKDYVGFRSLGDDDATALDAVFNTEGGTEVEVKSAAQTLVADTWYKFGVRSNSTTGRVYWYIDGAEISNQALTKISTTGFPDGEELAAYIAMKNGSGAIRKCGVDWIHVEFER